MTTSLSLLHAAPDTEIPDDIRDTYVPIAQLRQVFVPLAEMVPVGIPPAEALRSILDTIDNPRLALACRALADRVDRGIGFADACAEFPRIFSPAMLSALQVGTDTGRLGDACAEIAGMLEQDALMMGRLRKAAIMPIVTLALTLLIFAFMLLFLFPQMANVYDRLSPDELPRVTRVLLAMSHFYVAHPFSVTGAVIGGIAAAVVWIRGESGRLVVTSLAMTLPFIARLTEQFARVRYLSHLARLEKAGKSSAEAAVLAADSVVLPQLYDRYEMIGKRLAQGLALSDAMGESQQFPANVLAFVRAGERAGGLPDMLTKAAKFERENADARLDKIVELMPSILVVVVGFIVGVLILGAYGGIFALMKIAQHPGAM